MKDKTIIKKNTAINIVITQEDKDRLQIIANKNTDGNITKLIKLFANGKEIK